MKDEREIPAQPILARLLAAKERFLCPLHNWRAGAHTPKNGCDGCWAAYGRRRAMKDAEGQARSVGRAKGGGRSSKEKGRSACLHARNLILAAFGLEPADVLVKATSQMGVDLHLSPEAARRFPFAPEVKNSERLNIWEAIRQAQANAEKVSRPFIVLFKRAHTPMYATVEARQLLELCIYAWRGRTARTWEPRIGSGDPGKVESV